MSGGGNGKPIQTATTLAAPLAAWAIPNSGAGGGVLPNWLTAPVVRPDRSLSADRVRRSAIRAVASAEQHVTLAQQLNSVAIPPCHGGTAALPNASVDQRQRHRQRIRTATFRFESVGTMLWETELSPCHGGHGSNPFRKPRFGAGTSPVYSRSGSGSTASRRSSVTSPAHALDISVPLLTDFTNEDHTCRMAHQADAVGSACLAATLNRNPAAGNSCDDGIAEAGHAGWAKA